MKTAIFIALKVLALTVIQFLLFAVAGGVAGLSEAGDTTGDGQAGATAVTLLMVCFLNTVVLTPIILRSRWAGWQLMGAIFLVFYGVATVMPQTETAVFVTGLPPGMLPRLFLMGFLIAAPFSVIAVLLLGKAKVRAADSAPNARLNTPVREWIWKVAVIVLAYLILYFTFGYFLAWQEPAVREFYGGGDDVGFLVHMRSVFADDTWLIAFQMLRATLWVAIALPVIRMMKGRWLETALALGLLFAVPSAQLLLPNPFMPEAVRMAHLVETASSNFIFGWLIGLLLTRRRAVREVSTPPKAVAGVPGGARSTN